MSERPILFSAPMIRALLAGTKTQTRRVVKLPKWAGANCIEINERDMPLAVAEATGCLSAIPCPYGQPGDRLWVREAWRIGAWDENEGTIAIDYCDGPDKRWRTTGDDPDGEYFEDLWIGSCNELSRKGIEPGEDGRYHWPPGESPLRWRPSIHMPRCFSRILLEIFAVRVERLQDISENDSRAEGITDGGCTNCGESEPCGCLAPSPTARDAYIRLWESINGPGSWAANPFVWVVEFKRVTP